MITYFNAVPTMYYSYCCPSTAQFKPPCIALYQVIKYLANDVIISMQYLPTQIHQPLLSMNNYYAYSIDRTVTEDLDVITDTLDAAPHKTIIPPGNQRYIRDADPMERQAGRLIEWVHSDQHT